MDNTTTKNFTELLQQYGASSHKVVPYREDDRFLLLDLTEANSALQTDMLHDTDAFSEYIRLKREAAGVLYGIGGYNELRTVYSRSAVFGKDGEEMRRLHLGIDIWGEAGTPVYAPLEATVHSFACNDAFGDYGSTLVLQHERDGQLFHTLYGHLSLHSIQDLREGQDMEKGQWIGSFGNAEENGGWPPHLHFQVIADMEGKKGDYPGVCRFSERMRYLRNCPDPDQILNMMRFAVVSSGKAAGHQG